MFAGSEPDALALLPGAADGVGLFAVLGVLRQAGWTDLPVGGVIHRLPVYGAVVAVVCVAAFGDGSHAEGSSGHGGGMAAFPGVPAGLLEDCRPCTSKGTFCQGGNARCLHRSAVF